MMQVFDAHIHSGNRKPVPEEMLKCMEKAGVYGGCVFSAPPEENQEAEYSSFEERLDNVLAWAEGYEDRIFPILWIHPFEENILEKVHIAAERGICGFKIICNNFYIYEEQPVAVLKEIAKTGKPVFFHSGILWGSDEFSKYNRPLHWEALLKIEGLRFSMGHCSWPWIDECIALYGEFLNALTTRKTAEMFFDLTPGTPEIYRKELFHKLYECGYDVGDNVFFGTDATAETYSSDWSGKWLGIDGKILDQLGISAAYRQKIYHDNLMRFLGKARTQRVIKPPVPDDAGTWSAVNPKVPEIIEKWYRKLQFPSYMDGEFYEALKEIRISDAITIEKYDCREKDGRRNLLSFLYLCERLKEKYEARGIPEEILYDTAYDLVLWTKAWSGLKGGLYLGELEWLKSHMSGNLFRLGRLQFAPGKAHCDVPEYGIRKGDPIMEIHIPELGPLTREECETSVEKAKEFFAKYFPEYHYEYFTCHSWLLGLELAEYLPEGSNILKFQEMFHIVEQEDDDAILRYVFQWMTNRDTVKFQPASSAFAEKVKKAALKGAVFHCGLGVIKK